MRRYDLSLFETFIANGSQSSHPEVLKVQMIDAFAEDREVDWGRFESFIRPQSPLK